jgi:hypothetical protein
MAKQFRVNEIILSGKSLTVNATDSNTFWRHDGTFADPLSGNPSGYLTTATVGGVRTLSVTGLQSSGNLTFASAGQVQVTQSGQTIFFSGTTNTGAGEANTASNLGAGQGIFSGKQNVDLKFYSVTGAGSTSVSLSGGSIVISGSSSSNIDTGSFITTGQTGNFVGINQTGNFVTTDQTGLFITSSQTGAFAPISKQSKAITIPTPASGDRFPLFYTSNDLTLTKITTVLYVTGAGSPYVDFNIEQSFARTGSASAILSPVRETNGLSGTFRTSFTNATITGGAYVIYECSGASGVGDIHLTLEYN